MMLQLSFISSIFSIVLSLSVDPKLSKVWGPGLNPDKVIMPARYFFIEPRDTSNRKINSSVPDGFKTIIEGVTKDKRPCRIWTNNMDRKDGTYIIRYKLFDKCEDLKISVTYLNNHVHNSPYKVDGEILTDHCACPKVTLDDMLKSPTWNCGDIPQQLAADLNFFSGNVDWNILREEIIKTYDKPYSVSLCHYVVKDNRIFRKCYGKYVGFKMFMDSILLSLARKILLPDVEFFVNLGDWPLVTEKDKRFPIFSWCGSTDTYDIVMPTYDITESTLENMGRVMLDMLSVQGNTEKTWDERIPKAFWRGRDSSRERLKLIEISKQNPDIFNCSLTNFFFFRDEEKIYGPKTPHVSFYSFFDYKYQIGLDGTVASYRFPYLLAGGSVVFKQDSKYYEHFYNILEPYVHYVPVKNNLSDLVEKLKWAIDNDEKVKDIAYNARTFSNEHLLPKNIFCYYGQLLNEFSKKIVSPILVLKDMELVEQPKEKETCDCNNKQKDEL